VNWWLIGSGAVALGAAGLTLLLLFRMRDPACPQCRGRDWSKGVPPWRCRRCGANHHPGA
jgi:tRNA(Ile2) C34 agmatinyltransferase TiaS